MLKLTSIALAGAVAITAGAAEARVSGPSAIDIAAPAIAGHIGLQQVDHRPGPTVVARRAARLAVGAQVPPRRAVFIARHARYGLPEPRPGLRYAIYNDRVYLVDPDTLAVVAFMGVLAAATHR